jgi:secreted trypsin-like serine protease
VHDHTLGLRICAAVMAGVLSATLFRPVQAQASPITPLVIQGDEVSPRGKYPWQARLTEGVRASSGLPAYNAAGLFCGGVLLNARYVLTAAHCLWYDNVFAGYMLDRRAKPIFVILGDHDRAIHEGTEQAILVEQVYLHPGYTNPQTGWFDQPDLALLKLSTPAALNARVSPIETMTPEEEALLASAGAMGTLTGWGIFDDTRATSTVLREGALQFGALTPTHIQAMLDDPNLSGPGDSGGPFVAHVNGVPKLAGTISWAYGFARVAPESFWLRHVMTCSVEPCAMPMNAGLEPPAPRAFIPMLFRDAR